MKSIAGAEDVLWRSKAVTLALPLSAELDTVRPLDAVHTGRVPVVGDVGLTWDKLVIKYGDQSI